MTLRCGRRVVPVLLIVVAMGASSCGGNSNSKLNPSDAGKVADAPVASAPDGAAGAAGRTSSGGATAASAGSGGSAATASGGVSATAGSGARGGAAAGGSSSGGAGSGGSSGETTGAGGSGSGGVGSGGASRGGAGAGGSSSGTTGSGGTSGGTAGAGGSGSGGAGSGGSRGGTSGSGGATVPTGGGSAVDAGARDGSAPTRDGATVRDAGGRDGGGGRAGAGGSGGSTGAGGTISSSTGTDGCTDSEPADLTLQQIAVYQSVKIPIMTDGAQVATGSRNSAVVQGRDTLFRIFVTLGSGWTARELSARLTLTPTGGQGTQYYSRQTVSASSTEASFATTFQMLVPASAMTGSMTYSVQIVECATPSGSAGSAHFPATGDSDLGVKTTGGLKITIIPFQVGTLVPDTSQATLDLYTSMMTAMYPINAVSFTVGDTLTATSPVDWTTMLDQVRAKRTQDAPSADTYYFGLVKPASTLRTYCQSTCTSGIGFVVTNANQASGRAAVGVGFADKSSTMTMAHEVGHNHGRQHSPCAPNGLTISGVDPKYPYANGALGSWGWDGRSKTLFDPSKTTDIMGYCATQWISDYTYAGITTRVAAVNGNPAAMVLALAQTLSKWRVLLLDARGPRWGVPIEQEVSPEGEPEMATIYDKTGAVLTSVVVYRTEIGDMEASMVWVPEPKPDWYAVAVTGAPPHPFAAPVTTPRP